MRRLLPFLSSAGVFCTVSECSNWGLTGSRHVKAENAPNTP